MLWYDTKFQEVHAASIFRVMAKNGIDIGPDLGGAADATSPKEAQRV
jgi:hypothetical protein